MVLKYCIQTNLTLADKMRTRFTLTSRFLSELLNIDSFCSMVPFCLFCIRVARLVWHAAECCHRKVQMLNFRGAAF